MIKRLDKKKCLKKCDCCGKESIVGYYMAMRNRKISKIYQHSKKDMCKSCALKYEFLMTGRQSYLIKYNKEQAGKTLEQRLGVEKAKKCKQKLHDASAGSNNPMYGDYEHTKGWRRINDLRKGKTDQEFFGKEKAEQIAQKRHAALSGSKNPMYGKPSPQGSGNGWSGWYKKFYFRSILELSFLFKYDYVKSAENIKIEYTDYFGKTRTYHPDYIFNNIIYEIKPKRLIKTPLNTLKFNAAKKYCEQNNLQFVILTEFDIAIDYNVVKQKYLIGEIKFLDRYDKKIKELLNQ